MSCKRPLSNFTNLNFRLVQKKFERKTQKNEWLSAQKLFENDPLTLNYGHPSSVNTLSTWRLLRPLMKLDASWALPVYPVLKAQSHERRCANILQKDRAPIIHSNFRVVKTKLSPKNHHVPRILLKSLKKGDSKLNESVKNFIRSLISFDKDDELGLKIGGQKFITKSN